MKKLLLIPLLLVMLAGYSQDTIRLALKGTDDYKKIAAVEKYEGIYIFNSSLPVAPYDFLGNITITVMFFDYETIKEQFASKAKRGYKNADAVIVTKMSGDLCYGEVIRFKKRNEDSED